MSLLATELSDILRAGLAVSPISYANSFDPSDEIAALLRLGIPKGVVVWLDVEGVKDDPVTLIQRINTWAKAIQAAGYVAGLYVGAGVPLTSKELYALAVTRYWHSVSRVTDRNGNEAGPACGWCLFQCSPPNVIRAGIQVDVDFCQEDHLGRQVYFVAA